jgi:hypothetical protein
MTERPRKEQNISEYVAQVVHEAFEEHERQWQRTHVRDERGLQETRQRANRSWTPFGRELNRVETIARSNAIVEDATTGLLLLYLSMISEALVIMSKETKPTQAEQDELKAKFESVKKELDEFLTQRKKAFDEHLADRLAKLFDEKGHGAMYGASGNK